MEAPALELVVSVGPTVRAYPLPRAGRVTLGRADDADVRIDDASVSRQHAALHLDGALGIEDLGSANGTRFHAPGAASGAETSDLIERKLVKGRRVPLAVGQSVLIGSVTIAVRRVESTAPRVGTSSGDWAPLIRDAAMKALYDQASRIAGSTLSVLVLGETGVGKEVLAEAIHRASPRSSQPFLRLHCASLTETLLESELFGHERGAFTGAAGTKQGLFESAEGGTVFLDEVGELQPSTQVKLLRVLEERKVMRVGAVRPIEVDVRFVSATHRDLHAAVEKGTFRQDLLFRLNGVTLTVPPLRERPDEVVPLVERFAARAAAQNGRAAPVLSAEAMEALRAHPWPGNLRELRNVVERAVVLSGGAIIQPSHLGLEPVRRGEGAVPVAHTLPPTPTSTGGDFDAQVAALDRQRIVEALERAGGNQTLAARELGISRRTLVSRLGTYELPRPRKNRSR